MHMNEAGMSSKGCGGDWRAVPGLGSQCLPFERWLLWCVGGGGDWRHMVVESHFPREVGFARWQ